MAGEIRVIPSQSRATLYFCPSCKEAIKRLPEIKKAMEESQEDLKKTKKQGDETAKSLAKLKTDVESLKSSMERRKRENETIKEDITNIKKEITKVDEKIPGVSYADALKKLEKRVDTIKASEGSVAETGIEPTLFELKERERRANNILFFGVDEPNGPQHVDDKETIASLYTKMNLRMPENARVFRLGSEAPNKKRPIKVLLSSRHEALEALKKRKILEDNVPGVYLKCDQTENQRKYLRQVLADLEQKKNEGKLNLIIKYVNGIPRITEKIAKN